MKCERRATGFLSIYAVPILTGCAVLCLGWGAMRALWEINYKDDYQGGRSLSYYLSANWGDSLILPMICALMSFELRIFCDSVRWRPVIIAGVCGTLGGVVSQFMWVYDDKTLLNWTFTPQGSFNLSGWYHAGFLSIMCGILFAGATALTLLGYNRIQWGRSSVLRYLVVGYLFVLFACLLATDNRREPQGVIITNALTIISVATLPILASVVVIVAGVICCRRWKLLVSYAAILLTTSVIIPLALLIRGTTSISGNEVFCCTAATVFASTFVTAPATAGLVEQFARSLPTVVLVWVLSFSVVRIPETLLREKSIILLTGAMIVVNAMSLPSCLFDNSITEVFYTAFSGVLLVVLATFSSAVQISNNFADSALSIAFPFLISVGAGWWVKGNAKAVTSRESAATADDYVKYSADDNGGTIMRSDSVSMERRLRYKVLAGFMIHAGFVMLFLLWVRLSSITISAATSIWRVALCSVLVVIMTEGSFMFSRLSFRDNVFLLRGLSMSVADVIRVHVGAASVALLSAAYGTSMAIMSSTKVSLVCWTVILLLYVLSMLTVCAIFLHKMQGVRLKEWPDALSPRVSVLQDHIMSLSTLNVLGMGIIIWISDRLVDCRSVLLVCGVLVVPLASVFLFFLKNNIKHVASEKRRIESDISNGRAPDPQRGRDYLVNLERHCIAQNRTAALIVALSLWFYVVVEFGREFGDMRNAEGSVGFRALFGVDDWPSPPQL